jgi:pimeloyl-ACP methyl ester carboxylesterase
MIKKPFKSGLAPVLICAALSGIAGSPAEKNKDQKPNIIFILTFDQLISDVIEVTNYLRNRFKQEKIYLIAHSGGTSIGIQAAVKAPELYHAYIGMSQITNQLESEKLAFNFMTGQFTKLDDKKMLKKFEKFPVTEINTPSYCVMRDAPICINWELVRHDR